MTDIRKCAQAVLDEAENPFGRLNDFMTALEALRQALASEPSVDALIAEAVAKEREACAELCIKMGTEPMEWQPSKLGIRPEHWDVAQAIRARGIHTCHIHVPKKKTEAQKFLDVVWHPDNTDSVRVKLEKAVRILESL